MANYSPLQLLQLPPSRADHQPVSTALTIDPYTDLLWTGTSAGLIHSFCNPLQLSPNVRFPAVGSKPPGSNSKAQGYIPGLNTSVKQIRVTDREVWTLTEGGVGGRRRGGAARWSVLDHMRSMRCMIANPRHSHELIVGGTSQMMLVNVARGDVVKKMESKSIVHIAPIQRGIVCAHGSGGISIIDPRGGFKAQQTYDAHSGGLTGADATGHIICTWGWTNQHGRPIQDPYVKVFDARKLKPMAPIQFPPTPAFGLLHPTKSHKLIIASQSGSLQGIDMSTSTPSQFEQIATNSYLTSMAISPQGDYLSIGDAEGNVHMWTSHNLNSPDTLTPFNGYEGVLPEWPDQVEPPEPIYFDDSTPLNSVGMPFYTEPLLSNFPLADYAPVTSPLFNPPEPVPQNVLASLKVVDNVGYANNPRELKGKRYMRTARPGAGKRATGQAWSNVRKESGPKFRSEKERKRQASTQIDQVEEETLPGEIPKYYRKVEIKYSKFGIDDFDFGYYNRTDFSGLETDILNSYTNALLQSLFHSIPIRSVAKAHLTVDCQKEHCLLCEAGFLFRMLEDARGINCQASNFSRAFSATPQAVALDLLDMDDKSTSPYGSLIQSFNRWILSTFSNEAIVNNKSFSIRQPSLTQLKVGDNEAMSAIDQVVGMKTKTTNACSSCDNISIREGVLHVIDLQYPRKPTDLKLTELLRTSLLRESTTKATCAVCKQFVPLESRRTLSGELEESLPAILSVNAMVNSSEVFEVWKDRKNERFLPGRLCFSQAENGELRIDEDGKGVVYELASMVVQIQETSDAPAHLVSFSKVPATEESESSWMIFNDFLVRHVKEEEVFSFSAQWKVPAVLMYERVDRPSILRLDNLPTQIDPSILIQDVSLAWNRRKDLIKHSTLSTSELPEPGTLVAIDAEFVALQQEEMEFRSDGTKKILRPSHMSLARVSVLRGDGDSVGKPFIDDYILTKETVVDYLTEYSGIRSGDLDAQNSAHTLVPLKVAYKKLRLLVDLGCIFIGHGLSKDFRTINIFVPPDQILDTVNLYTVPSRQRKLSLRFLAWFILQKDIQTASHDSIEDAKYALLLYREFVKYEEEGRVEDVMENIFEEGQKYGFKPPHEQLKSSRANSPIPPLPNTQTGPSLPVAQYPNTSTQIHAVQERGGPSSHSNNPRQAQNFRSGQNLLSPPRMSGVVAPLPNSSRSKMDSSSMPEWRVREREKSGGSGDEPRRTGGGGNGNGNVKSPRRRNHHRP